MTQSRREVLGQFAGIAVAGTFGLLAGSQALAQGATAACYDPETLPFSQKSRRRSLGYVDVSADPSRHCSACAFFTASAQTCGTCQMLSGGPVSADGVCGSFAPAGAK